jgi:hypothetical protein
MQRPNPTAAEALAWRITRRCNGGACVRVAASDDRIIVGDAKRPDGPVIIYSRDDWTLFVDEIRLGRFDNL